MERAHTLKHCREAIRTELFISQSRGVWSAEGGKDLYTQALDKYEELKKRLQPKELPGDVQNELNRIAKHTDEHLVK